MYRRPAPCVLKICNRIMDLVNQVSMQSYVTSATCNVERYNYFHIERMRFHVHTNLVHHYHIILSHRKVKRRGKR